MTGRQFFYLDTQKVWHQIKVPQDASIGRGGTSSVSSISEDKAVKRYLPSFLTQKKREELSDKITIMAFRFQQFASLKEHPLAWPLGPVIATDSNLAALRQQKTPAWDPNDFCGFVMPRIRNPSSLEDIISSQTLRFRPINGADRVRILRRIAETFQICHDAGFIIGDVNLRNILISADTVLPTIIDCDSFQYRKFASHVGLPDFASPELLRRLEQNDNKFEGLLRTVDDDCHALAVIAFMTLMDGRHPYDCARAPPLVNARTSAIIEREFPYSALSKSEPPTGEEAKRYRLLPDDIKALFEKALFRGEPVKPETWVAPLDRFAGTTSAEMVTQLVREVQLPPIPPKPAKRLKWAIAIILLIIAVLVVLYKLTGR